MQFAFNTIKMMNNSVYSHKYAHIKGYNKCLMIFFIDVKKALNCMRSDTFYEVIKLAEITKNMCVNIKSCLDRGRSQMTSSNF